MIAVDEKLEAALPIHRSHPHGMGRTLREVWTHRELLRILTWREVRMRYKSSLLGIVWSVLNPLVLMCVYWFLFAIAFPSDVIPRLPAYILLGLVAWNFFAIGIMSASTSLIANAGIVTRVAFPRQLVPLSMVAHSFVNFLIGCVIVIPFLVITRSKPGIETIQVVPLVLLFVIFVAGIALLLAAGTVFFRDVEHLVGVLLFPLFFATPILWSFESLGIEGARKTILFFMNPVTPYVAGFRTMFYDPQWLTGWVWAYMVVLAAAALLLGLWVFSRVYDELPAEL